MCHAASRSLQIVFINQLELVLVSVFHVSSRSWTERAQKVERQQVKEDKGRWREAPNLKSLLVFYLKWRTQITFWGEGQPGEEDLNTWKQNETSLIKNPAEKIQGFFRITVIRYYHTHCKGRSSEKRWKQSFLIHIDPLLMRLTEMKIEGVEWTAFPEEHWLKRSDASSHCGWTLVLQGGIHLYFNF